MPNGVTVPLTIDVYKNGPEGERLVGSETFNQDVVKIGTLQSAHLKLDDATVSKMHAVLDVASADDVGITDLSSIGTTVNGSKISGRVRLQSGDVISLGATTLKIAVGDAVFDDALATQVSRGPEGARSTVMGMQVPVAAPTPAPIAPPIAATPFGSTPGPDAFADRRTGLRRAGAVCRARLRHARALADHRAPADRGPQRTCHPTSAKPPMPSRAPRPRQSQAARRDMSAIEVEDGSRAIEVVAMFEDAAIDVRHFTNPQAGEVTGATKAMFFGGHRRVRRRADRVPHRARSGFENARRVGSVGRRGQTALRVHSTAAATDLRRARRGVPRRRYVRRRNGFVSSPRRRAAARNYTIGPDENCALQRAGRAFAGREVPARALDGHGLRAHVHVADARRCHRGQSGDPARAIAVAWRAAIHRRCPARWRGPFRVARVAKSISVRTRSS